MNTQSNTDQAADTQAKEESLGAFTASKALFHLYEAAAPHMSKEQLELMARATEQAQIEAMNLSEIVEGIGLSIADDTKDDFGWKSRTPTLLFQIAYNIDAIAGMIQLGSCAEHRLQNPDQYPATKQECAA